VREGNQTPSREPERLMLDWTSPRRHKGFADARYKGSLTVGRAIRPRKALTRLQFRFQEVEDSRFTYARIYSTLKWRNGVKGVTNPTDARRRR
jgi:hypothetical protein